jgi:hypothetical protein
MTYRVVLAPPITPGDVLPDITLDSSRTVESIDPYDEVHSQVREVSAKVTRLPREQRDRYLNEAQYRLNGLWYRVLIFDAEDGTTIADSRSSVYGPASMRGEAGIIAGLAIAAGEVVVLTADDAQAMGL